MMERNTYQTPQPDRQDEEEDSRRGVYAGIISAIGLVFAGPHVLHGIEDVEMGLGPVELALGAIFPFLLAFSLVGVGYGLWRSDLPAAQLRRVVLWFVIGIVGTLLVTGVGVVYEFMHGVQLVHIPFVILNFATAGGIGGVIVGWYDAQQQLRTEQLRVFQKAVEHSGHSVLMTDPDGTIEYVNSKFESQTGYDWDEAVGQDPDILNSGEHDDPFYEDIWETISAGDIWTGEVVNQDKSGEEYVINQTIAPVTDEGNEIERFVAINTDITEQKHRQQELERQRDELAQLHQLMASMWEVTQALVSASTESDLEEGVCDALVATDFCEMAWIGTYDRRTETLTPSAAIGIDTEALETVELAAETSAGTLYREAVEGREVAITRETDEAIAPWHRGDDVGYHAAASIPIMQEELLYGTLNLYSNRPQAFNEDERDQLSELGDAIAHGLETIKTRKLLHADQVIELEFRSHDEQDFLVEASREVDSTLSLVGSVPLSNDRAVLYLQLDDGTVEQLEAVANERDDVEDIRVINEESETKRVTVAVRPDAAIAKRLMDMGAQVEHATATAGEATTVVHIPPDETVRSLIEEVRDDFPDLELVAKRETERTNEQEQPVHTQLSERQRAALYAAYHAGYFKSPRESTAEEIASEMGVSGPTFHKHLRRAEQLLLDSILEAHPPELQAEVA
ncbi:MAG: PAS domain S-box-containing protein [Haloarculaceae archaeon]|jgi:PAS domain S-box-containing protein